MKKFVLSFLGLFKAKTFIQGGIILLSLLSLILAFLYWRISDIHEQAVLKYSLDSADYEMRLSALEANLASTTAFNDYLNEQLGMEKGKNDFFDFQLRNITSSVGTLEKLSKTDKELLQKYSKVYFLNENYLPPSLTDISSTPYAYDKNESLQVHSSVWPYLQAMLQTGANQENIKLEIISAYRSFGEQATLKSSYSVMYGSGANRFSADQGYSEHQLGTTVDFTTPDLSSSFEGFAKTPEYKWLQQNAYKYGFILSYPQGNAYYQYEPWHWRFVGVSLATKLHNEGKAFYDLDQREIDQYLISIFD